MFQNTITQECVNVQQNASVIGQLVAPNHTFLIFSGTAGPIFMI